MKEANQGSLSTGGAPFGISTGDNAVEHRKILGMRVDAPSYESAVDLIVQWARAGVARYVCVATVHMVMEAYDSVDFRQAVNRAELVTPDGMPLVWGLRALGVRGATRVYGPDLMPQVLQAAAGEGISVGFYGGSEEVLSRLVEVCRERFPGLQVAYAYAPPFRLLTHQEKAEVAAKINDSGVRILFVGLGCPKQERWMAEHVNTTRVVMLGVGAAFDFITGTKLQAPPWLQRAGMEWLFRLTTEPSRLWRRYLRHNPRFVALFASQLLGLREFKG